MPPRSAERDTMDECSDLLGDDKDSVLELLDRLLNKGVVLGGDVSVSVADIELIYLRVQLLLSSVETARQAGWVLPRDREKADVSGRHV
jgi:hypothetical protein